MREASYQLRAAIQRERETQGLGDVPMWHESKTAFAVFMLRYRAEEAQAAYVALADDELDAIAGGK